MKSRYWFFFSLVLLLLNLVYVSAELRLLTSFLLLVHPFYSMGRRESRGRGDKRLVDAVSIAAIILIAVVYLSNDVVSYVVSNLIVLFAEWLYGIIRK